MCGHKSLISLTFPYLSLSEVVSKRHVNSHEASGPRWLCILLHCKTLCLPLASGSDWPKGEGRLNKKWKKIHRCQFLLTKVSHMKTSLKWLSTTKTVWINSIWMFGLTNSRPLCLPFVGLSSAEYQQPGKASCVSVNWTLGDAQLEVVNTATGRRRDSGTPSRLCKHALFTRWSRLYRKVRTDITRH